MAYKLAKYGYTHRKQIRSSLRRVRTRRRPSAFRSKKRYIMKKMKYKNHSPRQVGFTPGSGNTKRFRGYIDPTQYATRVIQAVALTTIPKTTTNNIDERNRDLICVKGFSINQSIINETAVPLWFHVALVIPRQTNSAGSNDFLRAFSGNQRAINATTSLDGMQWNNPINTDLYIVLKHKRFLLGPNGTAQTTYNDKKSSNQRNIKLYSKYNRQLRFNDGASGAPEQGQVFLLWYADVWLAPTGTVSTANAYTVQTQHVTYFQETMVLC